jgi:MFS family permease
MGIYVGLLTSSFCIGQLVFSLPIGWLSNKIGRRNVIIWSLIGNAVTIFLFGFGFSYPWAILTRSLCGAFNGMASVVNWSYIQMKAMLGEMTDESNRGRAFSLWQVAYGIGTVLGPVLGGVLVNPVEQYHVDIELFKTYPYLLPCIASAILSAISAILNMLYLEESEMIKKRWELAKSKIQPKVTSTPNPSSNDSKGKQIKTLEKNVLPIHSEELENSEPTFFSHITKNVLLNVSAYALWALIIVVYDEAYILYVAEPYIHGGLQLTPFSIGIGIAITGLFQLFGQLVIYPFLEKRIGNIKVFRVAGILVFNNNFILDYGFCSHAPILD